MADDNLRVRLGKSLAERPDPGHTGTHWAPGAWDAAKDFWADPNNRKEPKNHPVIIDEASLLKTPEDLQEILDLPEVPGLRETSTVDLPPDYDWIVAGYDPRGEGDKVEICEVTAGQIWTLKKVTVGEQIQIWYGDPLRQRWAWYARSIKTE